MKDRRESAIRQGVKGKPSLEKLEEKFAVVERRIRALLDENGALARRVDELERELAQTRNAARNLEVHEGKTAHIRKKVEAVLQSLESIAAKKQE